MVFLVSYREKHASSKSRETFFAEHNEQPSPEQIRALVNTISDGDFTEKSIALNKCPGFETNELIKAGITVLSFETAAQLGRTGTAQDQQLLDSK